MGSIHAHIIVMPNAWCISFLWLAAGSWNANDMLLVVSVFTLRLQWMQADGLFLVDETKADNDLVFC